MNQELCGRRIIHEDRLEAARQHLLDYAELDSMSELFKAMRSGRPASFVVIRDGEEIALEVSVQRSLAQ